MTITTKAPNAKTDSRERALTVTFRAENESEQRWLARFADALERHECYQDSIAYADEMFFERK